MKKKILFLSVMVMALVCLAVTASAASIDDVVFKKGANEVFVVGAGEISATVDITVDAETPASLITVAYEGDRLTSVQYEDVTLLPTQKTYQGSPVTATANTTNIDVMVWGSGFAPIGAKETLSKVSREIRVTDVSISEASGARTFTGYVDNNNKKIFIEQTIDWYTPNAPQGTYSATATCQDYVYYDCRPEGDYKALSNTLNYKLNGSDATANVSLSTDAPAKLTLTAANGSKKVYDVYLEKHVAFTAFNFDKKVDGKFVTTGNAGGSATTAWTIDATSAAFMGGNSRYASGWGLNVLGYDLRYSKIDELQDTTADTYLNITPQFGISGKAENDGSIQFLKKGNLNGSWQHIQIQDTASANVALRKDKYDYSFDFLCTEYSGSGTVFGAGISSGAGSTDYHAKLNIYSGPTANTLRIAYFCPSVEGYTGYGKNIATIEMGKWHNIRLVADADNTEGAKMMIIVDGEVVLATDYLYKDGVSLSTYPIGNIFKGDISSSFNGTFYLDNMITTYSQAKPIS